ncbi:tRNA (guanine-N(7)-)-methyltransferase non-catalytic subunit wuho [Euwallacea fornicatus]|uniref:tRNA (guanine-N(7)-)-methyltransferase non-catalytic subunit wuho n=1 Tax=Euwallacea fornicatus TaxID=995702 RepID=UPI00338F0AC5
MFIVQENQQEPTEFKLLMSISEQLLVVNSKNGCLKVLDIPEPPTAENTPKVPMKPAKKEIRTINCLEFSTDQQYIAISSENKQVIIFNSDFHIVKNIVLSRVASKVGFSLCNDILITDRTGDVYLYKMGDKFNIPTLILGHLSVISDMLITDCGNYIITSDRDEKIRVSHFPNAYNIVTYCLGHTEFVSALKLIKKTKVLLSASGDGTIRMWDYLQGKQIGLIDTKNLVDKSLLEKFANQMDAENVDILALPVTSIQTQENEDYVHLVVSLYTVDKLFLYKIMSKTLEFGHINTLEIGIQGFCYSLCSRLYILSNKFSVFEFKNGDFREKHYRMVEEMLLKYKDLFSLTVSDVTLWYKRKYDNIQDYLERKRLRLESK